MAKSQRPVGMDKLSSSDCMCASTEIMHVIDGTILTGSLLTMLTNNTNKCDTSNYQVLK